jgi:hypothetical protein
VLGGLAVLILLTGSLWLIALYLTHNSHDLNLQIGDSVFDVGKADKRAASIAADGAPFFFQDLLTGGTRDIYVLHSGADPATGWRAVAARPPGSPRRCTLVFPRGGSAFSDPCTHRSYPADGTGLPSYRVVVTVSGTVQVDLNRPG